MELGIKGIIIGLIIVLPGMSGGTVFLLLGLYEDLLKDIIRWRIKPYIPLGIGMVFGIFLGGATLVYVFEEYRDPGVVFLLGCVLASLRPILRGQSTKRWESWVILIMGIGIGYMMAGNPIEISDGSGDRSYFYLFLSGALSSATMIIPGLPGSGVMIIMGIYDDMLFYLSQLMIPRLLVFGVGGIVGVIGLAKVLETMYNRYRNVIAYGFSGLIIGSSRALIPYEWTFINLTIGILGFSFVWYYSREK